MKFHGFWAFSALALLGCVETPAEPTDKATAAVTPVPPPQLASCVYTPAPTSCNYTTERTDAWSYRCPWVPPHPQTPGDYSFNPLNVTDPKCHFVEMDSTFSHVLYCCLPDEGPLWCKTPLDVNGRCP
jgi:hypothetical protein